MQTSQTQRLGVLDWLFRVLTLVGPVLLAALTYDFLSGGASTPSGTPVALRVIMGLIAGPINLLVSALIIWRVPGNAVGRLMLLFGFSAIGWGFAYYEGTPLFRGPAFLLNYVYSVAVAVPSLSALLLIFPDGHVYPRRWKRWSMALIGLTMGLHILWLASNPTFYFTDLQGSPDYLVAIMAPNGLIFQQIALSMVTVITVISFASLVLRFRRSTVRERQQIKWVAWAGGILAVIGLVNTVAHLVAGWDVTLAWADYPMYFGGSLLPPLVIGAAILRYHLWDIDRIINRTLVYSAITGILAALYFGGVAVMQTVLVALTGQESPLAVVASTLAIAALFTPVRRRVQNIVDRRFFRRKYDAEKTVDAFARAARDEVDMDRLRGTLLGVVEDTMQPEHVSLWVRVP